MPLMILAPGTDAAFRHIADGFCLPFRHIADGFCLPVMLYFAMPGTVRRILEFYDLSLDSIKSSVLCNRW